MKPFGHLKLTLMQQGVHLPEAADGACAGRDGQEVELVLNSDFFVKTFIAPGGAGCARVVRRGGVLWLVSGRDEIEVGIVPPAEFLERREIRGAPGEKIFLDGYCLNLSLPAGGKTDKAATEEVFAVIQTAFEDGAADLVQLDMNYCTDADRGFQRFAPLVGEIKKRFSTFIALRGFPPGETRLIDKIYAAGVDLLNFPLERDAGSGDPGRIAPAPETLHALEYAVGVFAPGAVFTELVFGEDAINEAREKIDRLTQLGVVPLLKLPDRSATLVADYDRVAQVVRHLAQAAKRHKLSLKWLHPSCLYVTPLDAAFFTGDRKSARLAATPVYHSKFGRKASEGFAALRRKLRVKNISDSYESAGL